MKVKVNITYNALKLARNLPKIIDEIIEATTKDIVINAKERIDSVDYISFSQSHSKMPQLSDKTLAERRVGTLAGKPYGSPTTKKTPLKYTGKLYNTMKATSSGINMEKYGWYHNLGVSDINPRIRRPKREFLDVEFKKMKYDKKLDVFIESQLKKYFKK